MAIEAGRAAPAFSASRRTPPPRTPGSRGKYELPFRLLSDTDQKVVEKYGDFGEKMMYGKKTQGVIRSTVWVGPDGKVVQHWARVAKAADHPQQVLDALEGAD